MLSYFAQHHDNVSLGAESPSSNVLIINSLVMRRSGTTVEFYFVLKYYLSL